MATGTLKFSKQGKLAEIAFTGMKLTTQSESGNAIQIFTVLSDYAPASTYYAPVVFDGGKIALATINPSGQIIIQNYSGSAISTASSIYGVLPYATK